jgi:hypothetical protein
MPLLLNIYIYIYMLGTWKFSTSFELDVASSDQVVVLVKWVLYCIYSEACTRRAVIATTLRVRKM